jgi:hypothetical protein
MPCIKILKPLKETLSFGKRKKSLDIANGSWYLIWRFF